MDNTGQHRIDMVAEGARIPLRQAVREILTVAKQITGADWNRGDGSNGCVVLDRWRFKRLSASYEAETKPRDASDVEVAARAYVNTDSDIAATIAYANLVTAVQAAQG